jgi:hypothetical protein
LTRPLTQQQLRQQEQHQEQHLYSTDSLLQQQLVAADQSVRMQEQQAALQGPRQPL